MTYPRNPPRLSRILAHDWPALFCLLAIPGIWVVGALFPLLGRGATFGMTGALAIATPLSLAALAGLVWRILRIRRFFRIGRREMGTVFGVRIVRDRGRLEFGYTIDGRDYYTWSAVHRTPTIMKLHAGASVDVLVDPARPDSAIVWHLYA